MRLLSGRTKSRSQQSSGQLLASVAHRIDKVDGPAEFLVAGFFSFVMQCHSFMRGCEMSGAAIRAMLPRTCCGPEHRHTLRLEPIPAARCRHAIQTRSRPVVGSLAGDPEPHGVQSPCRPDRQTPPLACSFPPATAGYPRAHGQDPHPQSCSGPGHLAGKHQIASQQQTVDAHRVIRGGVLRQSDRLLTWDQSARAAMEVNVLPSGILFFPDAGFHRGD